MSVVQIQADFRLKSTDQVYQALQGIYDSYASKELIYPGLQDLYTRRDVCRNFLGGYWAAVDYNEGDVHESMSQFSTHLESIQKQVLDDITKFEGYAAQSSRPAGGMSTALPPIASRPGRIGNTWPGGPRTWPWRW